MSYVPPSKRKKEKKENHDEIPSAFISSTPKPEVKPVVNLDNEYFPTLGEIKEKDINKENENKISFASSLTTVIPKEEVVKEVADGWVIIQKGNKEPKFIFGEIMTDDLKETYKIIDDIQSQRRENAIYKILENYERYKEEDEIRFGTPTIQSWEVDSYLEQIALDKKLERLEQEFEEENNSDETSDDEYVTN